MEQEQQLLSLAQMYKYSFRPILFLLSAETAHSVTMGLLKFFLSIPFIKDVFKKMFCIIDEKLNRNIAGLNFKNPVGLAAGFDKNAKYIDELACLGFGCIEIGTVTPLPQSGNPKPRLFRLKKDNALIN